MIRMPEIQTAIDEAVDGTWEGAIHCGSNFVARIHGSTFLETARLLDQGISDLRASWDPDRGVWRT